jgi:hypothetical protein
MAGRKRKKKPKRTRGGDVAYRRCALAWRHGRNDPDRGAANWMLDPADLPVDPAAFMQTLRALGTLTQDPALKAIPAIIWRHDLVDGAGQWKRYAILASPFTRDLCDDIEGMIARGVSERQAIAEAVVKWSIEAQSFDAAHKRLTRLLREYRKAVGHKTR